MERRKAISKFTFEICGCNKSFSQIADVEVQNCHYGCLDFYIEADWLLKIIKAAAKRDYYCKFENCNHHIN